MALVVWLSVIIILIAIVLAILWVSSIRKRRLVSKLRVEIENQGNIDCRYQLLAEEPLGGLSFDFFQNGEPLQVVVKSDQKSVAAAQPTATTSPKRASSDSGKVDQAIGFSGALGNVLIGIGSLLPASIGKPILQAGNQLYQSSAKANQAQVVSQQAAELGKGPRPTEYPSSYQSDSIAPPTGITWAETLPVKPGEKLIVDLKIQASYFKKDMTRTVKVTSLASEGPQSPIVTADGVVKVRGGFLSHKFYPPLVIIGFGMLLLGFVYGLARLSMMVR